MEFQVQKLTIDQLKDRLKSHRPYMLVDVREKEAFMKGHIPGASNMFDGEVMPMVKRLNKGTDIILYGPDSCTKNTTCRDAAEKFMNQGSKFVFAYEDGLKGWGDGGNRIDRSDSSDCRSPKMTT
jgi:rhodanese-related sulfurtransferase